jgi:hypothetical protein
VMRIKLGIGLGLGSELATADKNKDIIMKHLIGLQSCF